MNFYTFFRTLVICSFFICSSLSTFCQTYVPDSLLTAVRSEKNDSLKIDAGLRILLLCQRADIDSSLFYSEKIQEIANKTGSPLIKSLANLNSAYSYYKRNDYLKFQEYNYKASQSLEKYPDNLLLAYSKNFNSFFEPDSATEIKYLREALAYSDGYRFPTVHNIIFWNNICHFFLNNKLIDSALYCSQKAFEYANLINDNYSTIYTLSNLADVAFQKKNYDLAFSYLQMGAKEAEQTKQDFDIANINCKIGVYSLQLEKDDAFKFFKKSLECSKKNAFDVYVASCYYMYLYYNQYPNTDSAIKYLENYTFGKDSLLNIRTHNQLLSLQFAEKAREEKFIQSKKELEEKRKHNLELVILSIVIISTLLLFLLLSKSIIVGIKVIKFLGIVLLLITFEFINLVLHPFFEHIFNNSAWKILLALVGVASLLTPLHHFTEKWVIQKLIDKNKLIKLKNARKVIKEFGDSSDLQV